MLTNLGFIALASLLGLALLIPARPIICIIPVMFLMTLMGFLSFTISRVLHQETDSARRATVLSVKGLIFNLGYGLFSFGFSLLLANFPDQPEGNALSQALVWQVPYFTIAAIALFVWAHFHLQRKVHR